MGYETSALTIILTLQVRLKGIKDCTKHVQSFAWWQFALNFANSEKRRMTTSILEVKRLTFEIHTMVLTGTRKIFLQLLSVVKKNHFHAPLH